MNLLDPLEGCSVVEVVETKSRTASAWGDSGLSHLWDWPGEEQRYHSYSLARQQGTRPEVSAWWFLIWQQDFGKSSALCSAGLGPFGECQRTQPPLH